jgi:hypothetical protein
LDSAISGIKIDPKFFDWLPLRAFLLSEREVWKEDLRELFELGMRCSTLKV